MWKHREVELVIDVGNTRMKMGLFARKRLVAMASAEAADFNAVSSFVADKGPSRCVVGSVAARNDHFLEALGTLAPVQMLAGDSPAPLLSRYATPATLGIDRLANAVATAALFPGRAALAIDAGTCITYDLLDARSTYLGGMITPGMHMRGRAMHAYSARLPHVEPVDTPPLPGVDTASSLAAGIHYGMIMEMEGFVRHFRQKFPGLAVVLTGGDAIRAARGLKSNIFAHPALTLVGLHTIAYHETDPRPAPAH